MKKLVLLLAVILTLSSCEEDKVMYEGPTFVSFQNLNPEISLNESVGSREMTIGIASVQSTDVTVQLEINEVSAVAGEDFNVPTSVVIPAGEQFVTFTIDITDNEDFNETKVFEIEIVSASSPEVEVGIVETGSYFKTIRIINDDCPSQYAFWIGDISVEDVGFGSTAGTASANDNGDCDILVVENDLPGVAAYAGETTNYTYALQFFPANEEGTVGSVIVPQTFAGEVTSGGVVYDSEYTAAGTYNTNTGEIILEYQLLAVSQSTGQVAGTFWSGTNIITVSN